MSQQQWNTVSADLVSRCNRELEKLKPPTVSGGHFKAVIEDDEVCLVVEDDLGLRTWYSHFRLLRKEDTGSFVEATEDRGELSQFVSDQCEDYIEDVIGLPVEDC